jgi:DNA-binding response OmpR family regulator
MRILIVDYDVDGETAAATLAHGLARSGHEIITAATGAAALGAHHQAELALLSLDLPDVDGLEVCRRIRETSDIPIIAFADRGAELDRVLALQAGSDDMVDKPYDLREVVARIEAVMRRSRPPAAPPGRSGVVSVSGLDLDAAARQARLHGRPIDLTRKEFELLFYLASHPEEVITRRRLMAEIWETPAPNASGPRTSRTIDTHVSSIRAKLGSSWICTVRGVGFRFGQA